MTRIGRFPDYRARRAIETFSDDVKTHAKEYKGQHADCCPHCAAWRAWQKHPEWKRLPEYWWKETRDGR